MNKMGFVIVLLIVMTATLAACGGHRELSTLAGRWESEHTTLEFFESGRGMETREGQEFEFAWIISNDTLVFTLLGYAEGSLLDALMSRILHGSPVEAFGFTLSDDGQNLIITDDHGHGHFNIVFQRVD